MTVERLIAVLFGIGVRRPNLTPGQRSRSCGGQPLGYYGELVVMMMMTEDVCLLIERLYTADLHLLLSALHRAAARATQQSPQYAAMPPEALAVPNS